MKKFFNILVIAAVMAMATSCFEWPSDRHEVDLVPVTAEQIAGRLFAQQPYGGTAWGDQLYEQVYFSPSGMVSVGVGTELGKTTSAHYGTYHCDGSTRIEIQGLKVFDYMSGTTWNIVAAELGKTKSGGMELYLGYDNGSGLTWDITLVYGEMALAPTVQPWVEEPTVISENEEGGPSVPVIALTVPAYPVTN